MDKKLFAAVLALAVAVGIAGGLVARRSVVVNVTPEKTSVSVQPSDVSVQVPPQEQQFGSSSDVTTNLTALSLTEDLTVAGTSTFSGTVSGVPKAVRSSMSSSATTTACTLTNQSGSDRVVTMLGVMDTGSASSLGTVTWQAGTSSLATGITSGSYAVNTSITRLDGTPVITTTSTPQLTEYLQWRVGSKLNFVSGTTTNSGYCYAVYQ